MKQCIATLGPEKTFAHRAAQEYISHRRTGQRIVLYPTIKKTFTAVGSECGYGILPIENMVEGYVQPVLDLLLHSSLLVVDEILLPIEFAFAANCADPAAIETVFAQFITQGQCTDFLDNYRDRDIITTASNGTSVQKLLQGKPADAAIVPAHILGERDFAYTVPNINDYPNNRTRFIVVSDHTVPFDPSVNYKTSIVIVEGKDRPGMLSDILQAFARRNINLVSIMSRPTKELLGRYHFFVDIEGHNEMDHIRETFTEIGEFNDVKVLGSYPRADNLV